ncbi:MAG: hypothetical protein GX633_03905 [Clostridiales bacterium]|nr:hypothetical protein [Clostridiales bacterium]
MENLFSKVNLTIGEAADSPFMNKIGIYQDGTTPMYRDVDGKLWAISGHSHVGHISVFSGTTLDDMKEEYPICTNFCVGHADYAFDRIRYPEGVKARGSVWPFGLYICPKTHRFFCFFHNETGWNGKGTAYDSLGPCEIPKLDSDFRHIGLMHSDDEGRNWTFDRWVMTAETVCFTENYNPGAGNVTGQKMGEICLGSGDFSIYIEPDGDYIYIFYNIIYVDMIAGHWTRCDTYLSRTRKRTDGIMGDFVKYYDGAFCEPGNFGKETPVFRNSWHPRVVYFEELKCYVATSSPLSFGDSNKIVADVMDIRTSTDLVNWSEPIRAKRAGSEFGNHYMAIVYDKQDRQPNIVPGKEFYILSNHNGTDVLKYLSKID